MQASRDRAFVFPVSEGFSEDGRALAREATDSMSIEAASRIGQAEASSELPETRASDSPPSAEVPPSRWAKVKRGVIIGGVIVGVVVAAVFLVPVVRTAMTTVSTDDAYVNSHVTYVAPRISETVTRVLVDDNDFVRKGELLVELDKAVERVRVEQEEAALNVARRAEVQALAQARAKSAQAKADHFKLESAMTNVRNQISGLRGAIARLDEARSSEALAKVEVGRFIEAGRRGAETPENVDIRRSDFVRTQARTRQAEEDIRGIRLALELPPDPPKGQALGEVPRDQDQRHSSVVSALAVFAQDLADLGLELPHYNEQPKAYIKRIHDLAPNGDLDLLIEKTASGAPGVESARAQVISAEKNLERARLDLSYCEIRADIDGFVSNRNVNPGNRIDPGQRLMAIRSASEIWVDCNFKETQLDVIRIGQPVDLYVDAYPHTVFHGRVTGFSPGTGQSLALLPAQNATGNFVKIVQRLPVRVELTDSNPSETPLLVGLSVTPYVRFKEKPEGPNAGRRLRGDFSSMLRSTPAPSGRQGESIPQRASSSTRS